MCDTNACGCGSTPAPEVPTPCCEPTPATEPCCEEACGATLADMNEVVSSGEEISEETLAELSDGKGDDDE